MIAGTPEEKPVRSSPWSASSNNEPAPTQPVDWSERIGVGGLYLFALCAWFTTAGANTAIGLMSLTAVYQWAINWRALTRERLFWVGLWFLLAVAFSTLWALSRDLAQPAAEIEAATDLAKLWMFLIFAWWMRGNQQRILLVLALALVGFLLGRARALDAHTIDALLAWRRDGLGYPVIAFGQYSAACLLGVILLSPRLWHSMQAWQRGLRWLAAAAWLALGVLLLQGVLVAQSRGVWVALVAVAVVLALFGRERRARKIRDHERGSWHWARPVIALLICAIVVFNSPIIVHRFAFGNSEFFDHLWSGKFELIQDIAVQTRLLMLELGLERWLERPWLGWGPGSTGYLLQESGNTLLAKHNDLHNGYVDLMVRLGLLGFLPLLVGTGLVFMALREAKRDRCLDRDVYLLLLALLLLHLLCSLTNFRLLNSDWRFYWLLFAGAACTCRLAKSIPLRSSSSR